VRHPLSAATLLVAATLLCGCASGLDVPPPAPVPTGAAAYTCSALHGRLPDEVGGHTVTATKPNSQYTSAWGNPAIVLRCGVPTPSALTATSQLLSVDGVDWLPEQLTAGYLFTTVGREVNVEVSVPDAYTPESDALADLSPVIAAMDPSRDPTVSPSPAPS
jgi:hypothetical protein